MLAIILCAGIDTQIEHDLANDDQLRGLPRALLPVGGRPMLSIWWDSIASTREITKVYIVSNARKYKHFERWATAHGIPAANVINDGVTSRQGSLGAARDLQLGLRRACPDGVMTEPVLVFAGDSLFFRHFDLEQVLHCFHANAKDREGGGSLALYYKMADDELARHRGVVELSSEDQRILSFKEKPESDNPTAASRLASPLFYVLRPEAVSLLNSWIEANKSQPKLSCGNFMEWAVPRTPFYGVRLPGGFSLVGVKAGLKEYRALDAMFLTRGRSGSADGSTPLRCSARAYARVGLMGNPSDGFNGKTIAVTIRNFFAEVHLEESNTLRLVPHPLYDPDSFGSINDLYKIARKEGYHGGLRLLMGTCKKFFELCLERSIALPRRNFTAKYDTNIPRQVGLAGSSAIVTALFKSLMRFYGLTDEDVALPDQPDFVLSVEQDEMGINAGLQDRVVQVYQGCVYMDFSKDADKYRDAYVRLPCSLLQGMPFFLAFAADPSDSGKQVIHNNVKQRWKDGDAKIIEGMEFFGRITLEARAAIEARDQAKLMELMTANFAKRRELYGDDVVDNGCGGPGSPMAQIAAKFGAACKFPGSGGAVVGLAKEADDLQKLQSAYQDAGYVFCRLEPFDPRDDE